MTFAALIDIGNSRIKWRLDDLSHASPGIGACHDSGGDEPAALPIAEVNALAARWAPFARRPVAAAAISNVASIAVGDAVEGALVATWPGIRIEQVAATAVEGDLVNGYAEPARLGADRWMAAVGGHALLPARPLLICSFGTATTIDLIVDDAARARFVGGLILPGPDAMRQALSRGTARLPDVPGTVVDFADNTADAIASGITAAQVGAVVYALRHARRRSGRAPTVLFAGGASRALLHAVAQVDADWHAIPDLVLRGLAVRARRTL